jgi:hypothetical protein
MMVWTRTVTRDSRQGVSPVPVTILLDDALASRLNQRAAAEHLTMQEYAHRLLGRVLTQLETAGSWHGRNQRRLQLIRKGLTAELSSEERRELEQLQTALDQRLEQVDEQLLQTLEQFPRPVAS